jgi:4-amino-4-deoxy-L-arabinose transferase-like glycosyltransferase
VLPVGVLGVYLILTGQIKENLKLKFVIPGILIFLLTSVPWYYLVIKQNGMAFVDYFFLKHNLERFASKEFAQHQEPFYFYLIVFGAGFFPWTISFIASLPEMFQNLRNNVKFKDKKFNLAFFENSDNKFKYLLLSIVWFLVILSFFSASKAKLATYIMPLFPVAAIMTGYFWNKYLFENNNSKNINISVIIFALMCIIAGVGFIPAMHLTPALIKLFGKSNIPFYSLIIALCFIVIPSFMILLLKKGMKKQVFGLKIVFITAVMLIWVHVGHNIYFKTGPCDLISYINYSKKISLPGDKFLPYGVNKPGMVFYSRHKINFLEKESELQEFLSQETPILVVIRNKTIPELSSGLKFNLIKSGIRYSLISNTNKEALEKFYADSE